MKGKKITFNMIAAMIDQSEPVGTITYGDVVIDVKNRLNMKQSMQFVQDIVDICFNDEEAEYIPEVFDLSVRICTMMHYAGFDAPKDVAKAYAVLYETDLFNRVIELIDGEQYDRLIDGALEKVHFKRDLLKATAAQKTIELINMMDGIVAKSAEAMKKMDTEKLTSAMNNLSDKLGAKAAETSSEQKDNVIVMPKRTGDGE